MGLCKILHTGRHLRQGLAIPVASSSVSTGLDLEAPQSPTKPRIVQQRAVLTAAGSRKECLRGIHGDIMAIKGLSTVSAKLLGQGD